MIQKVRTVSEKIVLKQKATIRFNRIESWFSGWMAKVEAFEAAGGPSPARSCIGAAPARS
jgi:hypothetical protein